jgi:hypothetical protein
MVLNSGTGITDHIDMLDKLVEVITARALTVVTIDGGGSGHAIGDVIGIASAGSTSTIVAQLEVTSVATGVIDGIRIYRGGAYSVDPTDVLTNAQSSTTGSGTGATFVLTFSAATWSVNRRTQEAASAAIGTAGTGYTVGDVLTVTGGVQGFAGADATFTVSTISGGGGTGPVTAVTVTTVGNFEESPANDVAVTGGTGTACELTVTWQNATKANNDEQVCMIEGAGLAAADEIHVIIRPYTISSGVDDAYNWQLLGATGYNSTLPIETQTGVDNTQINTGTGDLPATDVGSYLVLKDNDANPDISWWINHTGRRIVLVCKVEGSGTTFYMSAYMGLLNQAATDTEYPYPLWICGTTNDRDRMWTDSTNLTGGIVEVIGFGSSDPAGPGYLRKPDGTWRSHASETSSSASNRNVETEWGIWPFFNAGGQGGSSQVVSISSDVDWSGGSHDIIPSTGVPGTENILLKPTPGSGDPYYWMVAPLVSEQATGTFLTTGHHIRGEVAGVFWFNRGNTAIVSEDRFVLGTKRYTIFQNGNRTQNWSYFAMDED